MTDLLAHVESIWQAVVPTLPTFTVEVVPSIDSTSSELMRRARDGLVDPVLLVTEEQTAGRGRMGKGWHSRPGQSLTFSLALPLAPADWSGLSLAVGVSLAESLHPDVRLKWPNDLWLQERKLGGILVETAGRRRGRHRRCGGRDGAHATRRPLGSAHGCHRRRSAGPGGTRPGARRAALRYRRFRALCRPLRRP